MSDTIGYVVLERNQAGGRLALPDFSDIHTSREEAESAKQHNENFMASIGRGERYIIATLEVAEDDRD